MPKADPYGYVIAQYKDLEARLCSFMEVVPYIGANKQVLSPLLPCLLIEACCLIESIFNRLAGGIKNKCGLKRYVDTLEPLMMLDETSTILLTSPLQFLRPFEGWIGRPPLWWTAYNNVKHDRMNNLTCASYENVVLAVAGLNQVIVRSRMFVSHMVREGWIFDNETMCEIACSREERAIPAYVHAETTLFVSTMVGDVYSPGSNAIDFDSLSFWKFSGKLLSLLDRSDLI